jgi:hypothetical protein
MTPLVRRTSMALALALSWGSMLAHNLYELPLTPVDPENLGPLAVAGVIGLAYAAWPGARAVVAATLGWGVLNLAIGGIVTVLPLPILPFAPEQSISHYAAHVVYTVGQIPLVVLAFRGLRAGSAGPFETEIGARR